MAQAVTDFTDETHTFGIVMVGTDELMPSGKYRGETYEDLEGEVRRAIHRENYTKEQAFAWVKSFEEEGGRRGAFLVVARPHDSWDVVPS